MSEILVPTNVNLNERAAEGRELAFAMIADRRFPSALHRATLFFAGMWICAIALVESGQNDAQCEVFARNLPELLRDLIARVRAGKRASVTGVMQ